MLGKNLARSVTAVRWHTGFGNRGPGARPWRVLAIAGGLAVATALAFAPSLGHEFVAYDDLEWIVTNPDYNPPTFAKFGRSWVEAYPDLYTPVLWTVWGWLAFVARTTTDAGVVWDATAYHLFNVMAHVGASVMAFLVLRRLVRWDWGALAGAALFALHPIQVEAVAWVSGMKTPLSGFFALWSTWHYLCYADGDDNVPGRDGVAQGRHRRHIHYGIATFAFLLSLITKPTVVVLPLIIATVELLLRGRRVRDLIAPLGPWLVLAILFGVINKVAQPAPTVFRPTTWERVLVALDSLGFYFGKLLLPISLLPDYGRTPQSLVQGAGLWLRAIPAALVMIVAAAMCRRAPWLLAGVGIFVLGAFTTLGMIPYEYQVFSTVADRYVYLSILGPAVAVAYVCAVARTTGRADGDSRPRHALWRLVAF